MIRKLIYLLLLSASLINMAQANLTASSRTVFKGRITIATCNIVVGDDNQTVYLGEISTAELNAKGQSTPVPFTIRLYGCNTSDKVVKTLFDMTGKGATGPVIPVDGVSGVGLSLLDGAGNRLNFGQTSAGQKIQGGDNVLLYSAYMVKTGAVQAGNFARLLHYTLSYE
ncbi:fimbrial protein [Enterobacter cloacae]